MKALTLIQPYGGLIVTGVKRIENRTWPPPESVVGQRIAIHAGAKVDRDTIDDLVHFYRLTEAPSWRTSRAVIGVATLVGWIVEGATNPKFTPTPERVPPDQERWWNGPIGFLFEDEVELATPVPCKGMLGFWTLPPDVEAQVIAQVRRG